MPDLSSLVGVPRFERPPVARAEVKRAPQSQGDSLTVWLLNFSPDFAYEIPGSQWQPIGPALPQTGDRCVVAFDDDGDAWVVSWDVKQQELGSPPPEPVPTTLDTWHMPGTPGEPAFTGTWKSYGWNGVTATSYETGPGGYTAVAFKKDVFGRVHLKGFAINTGGAGAASTIFTLPEGYRPSARLIFDPATSATSALNRLDITPDGRLEVTSAVAVNNWIPLDGISFEASTVTTLDMFVGPQGPPWQPTPGPVVSAYSSANYTPSAAAYSGPVPFANDLGEDPDDLWDGTRFQPKQAGWYTVACQFPTMSHTGTPQINLYLVKNRSAAFPATGTIEANDSTWLFAGSGETTGTLHVTKDIYFNGTTDFVEVFAWFHNGTIAGGRNFFFTASAVGSAGPKGDEGPPWVPTDYTVEPWYWVGNDVSGGIGTWSAPWRRYGGNAPTPPGGAGSWAPKVHKDPLGKVTLTGLADKAGGNWAANETIFTLPAGYRPARDQIFAVETNTNTAQIRIYVDGRVQVGDRGGGSNPVGWISFASIEFDTETVTQMLAGPIGPKGDPGGPVPVGGSAGQVLRKVSGTDFDVEWAGDGDWVPITLSGTWAPLGNALQYPQPAVYKDGEGFVHLKGLITGGAANQTMFTLPAKYRPSTEPYQYHVFASSGGTLAQVTIRPNGDVRIETSYAGWVDLASLPPWRAS